MTQMEIKAIASLSRRPPQLQLVGLRIPLCRATVDSIPLMSTPAG